MDGTESLVASSRSSRTFRKPLQVRFIAISVIFVCDTNGFADRKALEESLQEDSDEEEEIDEKFLNLSGDDGALFRIAELLQGYSNYSSEDVWDEDSAYLEMLANEVRCLNFVRRFKADFVSLGRSASRETKPRYR